MALNCLKKALPKLLRELKPTIFAISKILWSADDMSSAAFFSLALLMSSLGVRAEMHFIFR